MKKREMISAIREAILRDNNYDGSYFEKFLANTIPFEDGEEIVRVLANKENKEVLAHILDEEDDSSFAYLDVIEDNIVQKIYDDIFAQTNVIRIV